MLALVFELVFDLEGLADAGTQTNSALGSGRLISEFQ